jgi:uncharacterized protein YbaR (Trm112 family)
MYIELIDLLRCPVEHEETWLVASFDRMEGRFIFAGKLGCPVCSATYEIIDGIPRFSSAQMPGNDPECSDEDVIRTAALLNLTRPDSLAVLCGSEAISANRVSEMTQARIVALNPGSHVEETERVAVVTCERRIPLASASVDAIALGDAASLVHDASRILRSGGRISADSSTELGAQFREIARDERHVVGELVGPVIQLERR